MHVRRGSARVALIAGSASRPLRRDFLGVIGEEGGGAGTNALGRWSESQKDGRRSHCC